MLTSCGVAFVLAAIRRARYWRTLALDTLTPMVAAASLTLSVSTKRNFRMCRYRSGKRSSNAPAIAARAPASEPVCGSSKKRRAAPSSIRVASAPMRRRSSGQRRLGGGGQIAAYLGPASPEAKRPQGGSEHFGGEILGVGRLPTLAYISGTPLWTSIVVRGKESARSRGLPGAAGSEQCRYQSLMSSAPGALG